jgi:hypothetical protein
MGIGVDIVITLKEYDLPKLLKRCRELEKRGFESVRPIKKMHTSTKNYRIEKHRKYKFDNITTRTVYVAYYRRG